MKLRASLFAFVLAAASVGWAQNQSNSPQTPPTFPGHPQTAPETMPPDQTAPPAQGSQSDVTNLGAQVQQAIASDSMLQNSDVKAVVQGDRLLLTGVVSSQNAKDRAEQIAAPYATQNNLKLINHIDVRS